MYILTSVLLLTLKDVSVDPLSTGKACPLYLFSTGLGVSLCFAFSTVLLITNGKNVVI